MGVESTHMQLHQIVENSATRIRAAEDSRAVARTIILDAAEFCFNALEESHPLCRAERYELLFGPKHGMAGWS